MRARIWRPALIAGLTLSVAAAAAVGQYTPGRSNYVAPSTPSVPSPTYSWEAPASGQQPTYQQPNYQQPTYQQPSYQQPSYQQPTYQQPGYTIPEPGPQQPYGQPAYGQPSYGQPPLAPVQAPAMVGVPMLTEAQMGDLTATIALYPDPLLAQILPAATTVEELTYADRWLEQHPGADEYAISRLPLEPQVKALMHYPTVLRLLVGHLDWTQSLGMAFAYQRDGLMNSIQRWRLQALTFGHLRSTPEQQVVAQGNMILILPAPQREVVYVPVYDPQVVYVQRARPQANVITFRAGGFSLRWLDNDVDWRERQVRVPVRRDWDRRDGRPDDWDGRRPGEGNPRDRRDERDTIVREPSREAPRGGGGGGGAGTTVTVPSPRENPRNTTVVVPAPQLPTPGPITARPANAQPSPTPAPAPEVKQVFVPGSLKPGVSYPQRIVTPQENKVVNVGPVMGPVAPGAGSAPPPNPPATPAGRGTPAGGRGQNRSGAPGTPF